MGITNIPCPLECKKINPETNEEVIGLLYEVTEGSKRYFCRTPNCKFAFLDENKDHHIVGLGIRKNNEMLTEKPLLVT